MRLGRFQSGKPWIVHTNSIIGTGKVDYKTYIGKFVALGFEKNCKKIGEDPIAGIEMGEPGKRVENPERWIRESLSFLKKNLPRLSL